MGWKIFWIAVAGGVGTLSRYGISSAANRLIQGSFPWGTLLVNMIGCLIAGAFWSLSKYQGSMSDSLRTIIFIGFLGAFTTFSAMIIDSIELARSHSLTNAIQYMLVQNLFGVVVMIGAIFAIRALKGS